MALNHAHWIYTGDDGFEVLSYSCSYCGHESPTEENVCQGCHSIMDEEEWRTMTIGDIVKIQNEYKALAKSNHFTKKALCDLLVPYRDRFNLTDRQILTIARDENREEIQDIMKKIFEE